MYTQTADKPRTANRQELIAKFTDRQYPESDTYANHRDWSHIQKRAAPTRAAK